MSDFPALEVAIGLAFLYFVLSLVCTTVNEGIASALRLRAKKLEKGVQNLLSAQEDISKEGRELAEKVFDHPLIQTLAPAKGLLNWRPRPSYVPSRHFVTALLAQQDAPANVRDAIKNLPSEPLKAALLSIYRGVGEDDEKFRKAVEQWFDDAMQRVSGWYKRQVQLILFVLALVVASALNADTLQIADRLWKDEGVRTAVVARAEKVGEAGDPDKAIDLERTLEQLEIPLGWSGETGDGPRDIPNDAGAWAGKVIGLLLTTFALLLGAPFWFDLLSKVTRIRGGGARPAATEAPRAPEGEPAPAKVEVIVTPGRGSGEGKPENEREPRERA